MKIFGFEILKSSMVAEIKKLSEQTKIIMGSRPDTLYAGYGTDAIKFPIFPMSVYEIEHLTIFSDVLRNVLLSLKFEMFRNGFDLRPKEGLENPSSEEANFFLKVKREVNLNKQTLKEVNETFEDDLNTWDDAYMLLVADYTYDDNGDLLDADPIEVLNIRSPDMGMVQDNNGLFGYDDKGQGQYFDPENRGELIIGESAKLQKEEETGRVMFVAAYVHVQSTAGYAGSGYSSSGTGDKADRLYYSQREIIHKSKFKPSLNFGMSPVVSVWQKVVTLFEQDRYLRLYFTKQRPPKGILAINTRSADSLQKAWTWLLDKVKMNPHMIWPLAIESPQGGGKFAEFIDFMSSLSEMQFTESRNEMRRQIGALYGIEPIFQNDLSTSGGLNNEGLQITVTNRAVETGQEIYNDGVNPRLMKFWKIVDYDLFLNPSEEQDEMKDLELEHKRLAIAMDYVKSGLKVSLIENKEFQIEEGELSIPEETEDFGPEGEDNFEISGTPQDPIAFMKGGVPKTESERKIRERGYKKKLLAELNKLIVGLGFKRNLGKKDVEARAKKLTNEFLKRMERKASGEFKRVYLKTIKDVGKDVGVSIGFSSVDQNAIEAIRNQKVFSEAFAGMNKDLNKKITDVISNAYKDPKLFSLSAMVENMREVTEKSDFALERIARTETTRVSNVARIVSYKKAEDITDKKLTFKWIGPKDKRTTDTCKRIKRRTEKGVSMDELISIMKEESEKDFPEFGVTKNSPIPHYSCRHVIVRKV